LGRRASVGYAGRYEECVKTADLRGHTRRVHRELYFGNKSGLGHSGREGPGHGTDQALVLPSRTVVVEGDDKDGEQEIKREDTEQLLVDR